MSDRRNVAGALWLWISGVSGYMGWSWYSYSGLYRWLAERQLEIWGSFFPEWTAIGPGLLLAGPALGRIGNMSRVVKESEPAFADPATRAVRTARAMAIWGVAATLVCAGAIALSKRVPDGSEAPTAIDWAALEAGEVPTGKVIIRGQVDPLISTGVAERSRTYERQTLYVAFRPDGDASASAVRLFVRRNVTSSAGTKQVFMPDQTGYLFETGLPPLAERDLRARGINVATRYYVLKAGDDARVEPYYVVAGVTGFGAFVCFLLAPLGLLQARQMRRKALA